MITVQITSKQFTADTTTHQVLGNAEDGSEDTTQTVELNTGIWDVTYSAQTPNGNYTAPYRFEGDRDMAESVMQEIVAALFA